MAKPDSSEPATLFPAACVEAASALIAKCLSENFDIVTAESCTGGLLAGCLTEVAGASAVFDRSFVTYSDDAKITLLGVSESIMFRHGAVSAPVARAMAEGAARQVSAVNRKTLGIAVTGIAGPGGGSAGKPVGLVHIAAALRPQTGTGELRHIEHRFGNPGRTAVRLKSVQAALEFTLASLEDWAPRGMGLAT